ncbi:hypothetical protein [Rhodococcus rhodochrous]|uniref:hypothetical protein n=1 Tax=Rhodococcus rhodochrous TaxID=1829 RepID=UPI003FD293A9
MRTLARKPDVFALAGLAVAVVLTVTGCEGDGQSGIPTESPEPSAVESVEETTASAAAPTVVVGDVPGNPAATVALQAWTNDLVAGTDVVGRCWTIAPERARQMYADVDAITAAVQQPGRDGQYAVTWSAGGVDVSVLRSEIASGYACPYVNPTGAPGYTDEDARYAVERFLGRVIGAPVDPDDTEERYPLVCEARGTWDPWGTGNPGVPPLATDPDVLGDLDSFDAAAASVTPISEAYASVTIPIVEAGTPRDLVVLLTTGSNGYCLGAMD